MKVKQGGCRMDAVTGDTELHGFEGYEPKSVVLPILLQVIALHEGCKTAVYRTIQHDVVQGGHLHSIVRNIPRTGTCTLLYIIILRKGGCSTLSSKAWKRRGELHTNDAKMTSRQRTNPPSAKQGRLL